jgi:hypothetical protein
MWLCSIKVEMSRLVRRSFQRDETGGKGAIILKISTYYLQLPHFAFNFPACNKLAELAPRQTDRTVRPAAGELPSGPLVFVIDEN